jgi:hypothetical protein
MTTRLSQRPSALDAPPDPTTRTDRTHRWSDAHWGLVEADAAALSPDALIVPTVDLQRAAETAMRVCEATLDDRTLHARFLALASVGEFDAACFEQLPRFAAVAWQARRLQQIAELAESEAKVPPALVTRARMLYRRMLPVARYQLSRVAAAERLLARLNHAPGHRRLALNLLDVADLYRHHHDLVARDADGYRATDEAEARDAASDVVRALGAQHVTDADRWDDRCARVWTLLSGCYGKVQATGRFLLREREAAAKERFPSLVTASRGR